MSKIVVMLVLTAIGVGGAVAFSPFYGVAIYYLFAVLRPQFIWEWDLPAGIPWSLFVGLSAIVTTAIWRLGTMVAPNRHRDFHPPRWHGGHLALGFFAFWLAVAFVTAFNRSVALPYAEEYLKIFTMMAVGSLAIVTIRQVWSLYLIVAMALSYLAYEMNFMYLVQGHLYIHRRGYGGLDNNGAALMLAMGVPLCLYAWDGIRHWVRWLFLMCIPFIVHAVLMSYSRGAMLALVLSVPLYAIRCRSRGQLAALMLAIAVMIPIMAGKEIQERFFSVGEYKDDGSAQNRFQTWGIAWDMACERPLAGYGIRNSNLFTKSYGADIEGRTIHSLFLQLAADTGLVGIGAYLLVILLFFVSLAKARRLAIATEGMTGEATAAAAMQISGWDPNRARTIANGLEGSMVVFCVGAFFLSLETFELPFILIMMGMQIHAIGQVYEERMKVYERAEAKDVPA